MTQTEESYIDVHKVVQILPNYLFWSWTESCETRLYSFRVYQILPTISKHEFELHKMNSITKSTKRE